MERSPSGIAGRPPRNFNSQAVVSRLSAGGWESPEKVFATPVPMYDLGAATNDAGEILLAGTVSSGSGGVTDVRGTIAPSISAPWPDITLLSPAGIAAKQYRSEKVVAAAGNAFYAGWGVHGGSNDGSQVIATRTPASWLCNGADPDADGNADADAHGNADGDPNAHPDSAAPAASPQPLPVPLRPPPRTRCRSRTSRAAAARSPTSRRSRPPRSACAGAS